jgi:tetratricopeptide (TPR) repeat protein
MKDGYGLLSKWVRASLALMMVLFLLLAAFEPARADGDGPLVPGYILQDGQRIPAPTSYIQAGSFSGEGKAYGPFLAPQDLFLDPATGNLLVADTGNNRVIVLDRNGKLLLEIGGESAGLNGPEGVFVDQMGSIWVADKGNQRVAVFNSDGTFLDQHTKPDSSYLDNVDFKPSKILVDKRGFMYIVTGSENTLGVLVIDSSERFRGFFGRTRIRFDLGRVIARALATKEQRRRMLSISPAPLNNLYLDSQGFIYAVSPILTKDQIQRLNSVGTNVYGEVGTRTGAGRLWDKLRNKEGIVFGEQEVRWGWNDRMRMSVPRTHGAQFIDLAVDDLGIVSVIDSRNNQIYQYDQSGNLLAIFGGQGASKGFFIQPSSIVAGELGMLYILDSGRGNIQIFRPTELTRMIHQASFEYFNGEYDRAAALWNEIAQRNTNFSLAHSGLGKALMGQKRYEDAMQEYYYAENKFGYSAAFSEYRYLWMRARFSWIGLGVLGTVLVVGISGSRAMSGLRRLILRLQIMQDEAGLWAVPVLLALTVLSWMVSLSVLSFHYQTRRPDEIRLLFEAGKIILPWITWCVSAFGVGEIFFGEGTFRKILIRSAWALWPVIVLAIPVNLITNVISLDERVIHDTLWVVILTLTALQFLFLIRDTHNFDFTQAVGVTLLTLVGIVAIWILLGLVYALSAEIFRFIGQLIMEVYVRLY